MRQAVILLMMIFSFVIGCGSADSPPYQNKPTKENLSVEKENQKPLRIVFYDFSDP